MWGSQRSSRIRTHRQPASARPHSIQPMWANGEWSSNGCGAYRFSVFFFFEILFSLSNLVPYKFEIATGVKHRVSSVSVLDSRRLNMPTGYSCSNFNVTLFFSCYPRVIVVYLIKTYIITIFCI